MSSDPPSDAPSSPAEPGDSEAGLAALLRSRGAPLVEALERHLPGAGEHAEGTAAYAFASAVELGFERPQCEVAREIAMLHEVGLLYVPATVLAKPPNVRDATEEASWVGHYEAGYRLLGGAGIPDYARGWLLRARERYDGNGPERLAADAIPIESRIIRAACACETALAGAEELGAKPAVGRVIAQLADAAGSELDPRVVAALTAILERAVRTRTDAT
jgi:HD-GYP domain-containing protein (c-di-GMP phosphodiesterase class II)